MAIHVYWASGSPYSWRVLLALEFKGVPYVSHQLQLSKQEHKSPQMLAMTPRGRLPVVKHDDYVVFESLAIRITSTSSIPSRRCLVGPPRKRV